MPNTSRTVDKLSEQLEHERLTSLINSMADAVIATDKQARIKLYNAAALNIFDLNSIPEGTQLGAICKPIDAADQPVSIDDLVKNTTVPQTNRDLRLKYPDGSRINLYISIAPVRLGYGSKGETGYVLLLRDITREKSLEEERDEFISVVSHELRTPIAIAEGNIGNAELIVSKSGDPEAIKKALREAHNQVMFLSDMINDLATLSRAERGKLRVDIEPINIRELAAELAGDYRPQAEAKKLEFKLILDPQLSTLSSSKLYVREILQNLLTNAVKYTDQGSVSIQVLPSPFGAYFSVADTGIGISRGDRERVYDKFFRSEDYRTRQANGTGLGLYVTTKLARLIHAELSLESELNKGSTFTVFFPNLR